MSFSVGRVLVVNEARAWSTTPTADRPRSCMSLKQSSAGRSNATVSCGQGPERHTETRPRVFWISSGCGVF